LKSVAFLKKSAKKTFVMVLQTCVPLDAQDKSFLLLFFKKRSASLLSHSASG